MKYIVFVIALISVSTPIFGADPPLEHKLPSETTALLRECNMEARNSLIHEDLKLVENICMKAVNEVDKSSADKKLMLNPLLNLAYSYTLAGKFEKATPLYERALSLGSKVYEPDSRKLKEINDLFSVHKKMQSSSR